MLAVVRIDSPLCLEPVNDVPILAKVVHQLNLLSTIHQIVIVMDDSNINMDLHFLDEYRVAIVADPRDLVMEEENDKEVLLCPPDIPFLDAVVVQQFLKQTRPFGRMITYHGKDTGVYIIPTSSYLAETWRDHADWKPFVVDDMIGIRVHKCEQRLTEIQQIFDQPFVSFHDQSEIKKCHILAFLSERMSMEQARKLFEDVHMNFPMKSILFQWHPWTGITVLGVFTFKFYSYKIGIIERIVENPVLRHEGLYHVMEDHLVEWGRRAGCRKVRYR